jgi:transposase
MISFAQIVGMTAVRRGFNAGQSVRELSKVSGKSASTVRRWLKATGLQSTRR